jgi:hypothetical protein
MQSSSDFPVPKKEKRKKDTDTSNSHCTVPSNKLTKFAETTIRGCEKLLKTMPLLSQV